MNSSRTYVWITMVALLATAGSAFADIVGTAVPEPVSTIGLLGISVVALAMGRKIWRK